MTSPRLSLTLLLALLGGVNVGGVATGARWDAATRAAEEATLAERSASRWLEEAVAAARVRLALDRARLIPYDEAPVHLVVSRSDASLRLERGPIVLRTANLVTVAVVGIDTVTAVTASGVSFVRGGRFDAASGLSRADLAAVHRLVRVGALVYVR